MQSCGGLVALARSTRAPSKRRARNGATATTRRRPPRGLWTVRWAGAEGPVVVERPGDGAPAARQVLLAVAVVALRVHERHLGDGRVALLLEDAGGADGQRARRHDE